MAAGRAANPRDEALMTAWGSVAQARQEEGTILARQRQIRAYEGSAQAASMRGLRSWACADQRCAGRASLVGCREHMLAEVSVFARPRPQCRVCIAPYLLGDPLLPFLVPKKPDFVVISGAADTRGWGEQDSNVTRCAHVTCRAHSNSILSSGRADISAVERTRRQKDAGRLPKSAAHPSRPCAPAA